MHDTSDFIVPWLTYLRAPLQSLMFGFFNQGAPADRCKKTQLETADRGIAKDHHSQNSMKFTEDASGTLVNVAGTAQKECQVKQHGTSSCGNLWLSGSTHGWIAYKMGISRFASQKNNALPYFYDHLLGLLPTPHKGRGEYKGGISWNNLTCLKCNYI